MLQPVETWSPAPRPHLRAAPLIGLVALLALVLAVLLGSATAAVAHDAAMTRTPAAAVDEVGPLAVVIDQVTPDALVTAEDASVTVAGTVTNTSEELWSAIRVYPVVSSTPITSGSDLAEAAASPDDTFIGNRITDEGAYDPAITTLSPGQTQRFTLTVPAASLDIDGTPGVYWLGVHALGETAQGRTSNAAGKARTFLPILPADTAADPMPTSVVVPLREPVAYTADGAVADPERWTELLGAEGRLREILDLAGTPDAASVTWLLDPALLDVARQLAEGNPPRDLAPAEAPQPDPSAPADEVPDDEGNDQGNDQGNDDETGETDDANDDAIDAMPDVAEGELAETAGAWLADALTLLAPLDLYVLPYGDVDLEGIAQTDPGLYGVSRALARDAAQRYGLEALPALAPPAEGITPAVLELVDDNETILVPDAHLPGGALGGGEAFGTAGEKTIAAVDTSAASGGPGPGVTTTPLQIRQRIVSETVIDDLVAASPSSRTVVLPADWDPAGADLPIPDRPSVAIDPLPLTSAQPATLTELQPDQVVVEAPESVTPASSVRDARTFLRDGQRLDRVLPDTDAVAPRVAREAVVNLSYADRAGLEEARAASEAGSEEIDALLDQISVEVAQGITLASESGKFNASVTNGLDQPIQVVVEGSGAEGVTITTSDPITLPAGGSTTVLLDLRIERLGVHEVEVRVTDTDGVPLGTPAEVPVRSAAVSEVIWLVIGGGFLVLVLASSLWLRRRRREAEAEQ